MFIGDVIPTQFFGPQILLTPMATAIARLYTRQGFVVAADGRKCFEDKGVLQVISDTQQKVYSLETGEMRIAYCMAGTIVITPEDKKDEVAFDLVEESATAHAALAERKFDLLKGYTEAFAELIQDRLTAIQQIPNVKFPERKRQPEQENFVICHVFFDGYFQGQPQRSFIRFAHKDQRLVQPFVSAEDLYMGHVLGHGSMIVHNLVFRTDDQRFRKYRLPHRLPDELELRDGVEMIKNFINACSSPEALEVDAERCAGIGGHVCIATITPSKGFRWVKDHTPLAQ